MKQRSEIQDPTTLVGVERIEVCKSYAVLLLSGLFLQCPLSSSTRTHKIELLGDIFAMFFRGLEHSYYCERLDADASHFKPGAQTRFL